MAITKALTFSKDAERLMVDIGPFRPKMLNLVFTQQKGCQHIYRKTVQYDMRILQEIPNRLQKILELDIDYKEAK